MYIVFMINCTLSQIYLCISIGPNLLRGKTFLLAIDGQVMLHDAVTFGTALSLLFAAFYIFNVQYPTEVAATAATLDFIQR